jgi:hypothetical protein
MGSAVARMECNGIREHNSPDFIRATYKGGLDLRLAVFLYSCDDGSAKVTVRDLTLNSLVAGRYPRRIIHACESTQPRPADINHLRERKCAPGPHYLTPFGMLADFRRDPLKFYLDAAKYGDVVRIQIGRSCFHFVTHPEHIKYALQDNAQNYGRSRLMNMLKSALGDGLLTSDGDFWRRQRRLAQPAFHRQRIGAFATIMTESTQTMLERWDALAAREQPRAWGDVAFHARR